MKNKKYIAHKPQLRIEFLHRCVYCDVREPEIGGAESYCVDHYKPQKKFPELILEYNNLLYSCRKCNQHKSDYWPNFIQQLAGFIVLNPREHDSNLHIDKTDLKWDGTTSQGKWNITRLKLNSDVKIQIRKDRKEIEETIAFLNETIAQKNQTISLLIQANADSILIQEIESEIDNFSRKIDALTRKISGPLD